MSSIDIDILVHASPISKSTDLLFEFGNNFSTFWYDMLFIYKASQIYACAFTSLWVILSPQPCSAWY